MEKNSWKFISVYDNSSETFICTTMERFDTTHNERMNVEVEGAD